MRRILRKIKSLITGRPPNFNPADDPNNPFPIDAWTTKEAYRAWFEDHKALPSQLEEQKKHVFEDNPLFSFVVPLYRTTDEFLTHMADSVLAQTYGNLELILVNATPEDPQLKEKTAAYADADPRVEIVSLDANYGITENTNRGLARAKGDFVCFLDHDDYIEPDLLYEYAAAINENPLIDVLYCDEDLVSFGEEGFVAQHPLFKPVYSPELLLCKNYIVHLMTIRRSLIEAMPVPDRRFDGAQDYNMVLFCTLHARYVHNVAKVLYHWRISDNSTAANPQAKPYGKRAYRLSAQQHFDRLGCGGNIIASGLINIHNLWFSADTGSFLKTRRPKVSLVAACPEDPFLTERFIEFFLQTNSYAPCELILVGNAEVEKCLGRYRPDTQKTAAFSSQGEDARSSTDDGKNDGCLAATPLLFAEAPEDASVFASFNAGARLSRGSYLLFMHGSDFFATAEPLEQLLSLCALDGVGAAAPKTLYAAGENRTFGVAVTKERIMPLYRGYPDDFPGYQCNLRAFQNCSAVSFRGMMIAKKTFDEVGGFDEDYTDEIGTADLCLRVRAKRLRCVVTPTVKVQTDDACPYPGYDNASNAQEYRTDDLARFDEKWPDARTKGDPYLNRNLDQASSYLQIEEPYRLAAQQQ